MKLTRKLICAILVCAIAMSMVGMGISVSAASISGTDITWTVKDGVLTISGKGDMPDYQRGESKPWDGKSFTKVIVQDGITKIGSCTFMNNTKLTSAVLADSITEIGGSAFAYCSGLVISTLPANLQVMGPTAFFGCSSITEMTVPGSLKTLYAAFSSMTNLKKVVLEEGITSISDSFQNCRGLQTIIFPSTLKTVEKSSFTDCSSLTALNLPASVTTIGDNCFSHPAMLTELVLPEGLTSIGEYVFSAAERLTSVTVPESLKTISADAFDYSPKLKDVYFSGTKTQWNAISKQNNFNGAAVHYTQPGVTKVSTENTGTGVKITWDKADKATGYYVYRAELVDGKYTTPERIKITSSTSYTDTTAQSGKTYRYYVRSYRKFADGTYRYGEYLKKYSTRVYLAKPVLSSAANTNYGTTNGVQVKWKAVSGVTGYYVYRQNGKTWDRIAIVSKDKLSYIDTTAEAGKLYTYTVKAYYKDAAGKYTYSTMNETGISVYRLGRSSSLTVTASTTAGKMSVKWPAKTGVTGVQVMWCKDSGFVSDTHTKKVTGTSTTVTGLDQGTYYVRIRTYYTDETGKIWYSGWSSAKSVEIH